MAPQVLALSTKPRPTSDSIIMVSVVKGNVATFTPATCDSKDHGKRDVINRKSIQNRGQDSPIPGLF